MPLIAFAVGVLVGRWWRWELERNRMWRHVHDLLERSTR
jgi:hypothetical protein